jgi:hypothetical protein
MSDVDLPTWPGWHLIGAYPDHEPGDVGSWILHDGGEALLLEVPEGLTVADVRDALERLVNSRLRFVAASLATRRAPAVPMPFRSRPRARYSSKVSSPIVATRCQQEESIFSNPKSARRGVWLGGNMVLPPSLVPSFFGISSWGIEDSLHQAYIA